MEIKNIIVASTTREGNYTLNFDINGTNETNLTVSLDIDSQGYNAIMSNQSLGSKTYNGVGLSEGKHKAQLKVSDGTNEVESDIFNIIIKNIPTLNDFKLEMFDSEGNYLIAYDLGGYKGDEFLVQLQVDGGTWTTINSNAPIGLSSYEGSGLALGVHTAKLKATMDSYVLESDEIEIEIKVLPKIKNIIVSDNTQEGNYKLTFDIEGDTNHSYNVDLRIGDNEYQRILSNQSIGTGKVYNGTNLRLGNHKSVLKISDNKDSYTTDEFYILIKRVNGLQNISMIDSNSKGEYEIKFDILGDEAFLNTVEINIDDSGYKTIMLGQSIGTKIYKGEGLSLGIHNATLRINDTIDTFESPSFEINVKNKVPTISNILVTDTTSDGQYTLNYATKDAETQNLIHKLKVDNGTYTTISVSKNENFFTYQGSGLTEGEHTCYIQISDGLDKITSNVFKIVILSSSTTSKQRLYEANKRVNLAYEDLQATINNVIQDGLFNGELENPLIAKALENFKNRKAEYELEHLKCIDITSSNKVTDARADLEESINGVNTSVSNLETTMNGVFKDGILSDAEKDTIRKQLSLISKEKADVDKDYEVLYANEDLIDPAKTELKTAYDNFNAEHNELTTTINNIAEKSTIVDETDRTELENAFSEWRSTLATYKEKSLRAIDSIAQTKADNSADVVDRKYAEIVLDPETGIVAKVGQVETTVNGQNETISKLESTVNQSAGSIQLAVEKATTAEGTANDAKAQIEVAVGQISSKVEKNGVISAINQSAESISISASKINLSGYVTVGDLNNYPTYGDLGDYLTASDVGRYGSTVIYGGLIMTDTLALDTLTSNNENPIIKLFDTGNGYCSLDATNYNETGHGDAIRLKWNSDNYIRISANSIEFYGGGMPTGYSMFQMTGGASCQTLTAHSGAMDFYSDQVRYKGRKLAWFDELYWNNISGKPSSFYPSSHSHPEYADEYHTHYALYGQSDSSAVICEYNSSSGMYTLRKHTSSGMDLGTPGFRWYTIYSSNSLNTSDRKFKENIVYLDEMPQLQSRVALMLLDTTETTTTPTVQETPFLDFIRDDFRPATFNYKTRNQDGEIPIANYQIGFIANDIADTQVGQYFLYDYGEEDGLMYSPNGYTTVIGIALKEEIGVREQEIAILKEENISLRNDIEELKLAIQELKGV